MAVIHPKLITILIPIKLDILARDTQGVHCNASGQGHFPRVAAGYSKTNYTVICRHGQQIHVQSQIYPHKRLTFDDDSFSH